MDVDFQWPESDLETVTGECSECRETCAVQLRVDPFVEEGICEGPTEPQYWCRSCYSLRCEEV